MQTDIFPLKKGRTRMGMTHIVGANGIDRGVIHGEALVDEIIHRVNNWDKVIELLNEAMLVVPDDMDGNGIESKVYNFLNEIDERNGNII